MPLIIHVENTKVARGGFGTFVSMPTTEYEFGEYSRQWPRLLQYLVRRREVY